MAAVTKPEGKDRAGAPALSGIVYAMVFASGFAGLVYQVLWMKQLGLLFGNTAHAAATTLAAFFAGLAAGSYFWGKRSKIAARPFRMYAWLEAGIAATALLYFAVLAIFYYIYPFVYQNVASGFLLYVVKFALAILLIFPPAFFMGGTIPVIGQFLIRRQDVFGTRSAWLYGINTAGAALGAFVPAFFLVLLLGYRLTCVVAVVVTAALSAVAFCLSRADAPREGTPATDVTLKRAKKKDTRKEARARARAGGRKWILPICFLSGFGVLALEVVWTRIFAQVHENSVYSFAAVLVVVLVSLAVGAVISSRLARLSFAPKQVLTVLMIAGGASVVLSPFIFMYVTDDLTMISTRGSLVRYVLTVFRQGFVTVGLPALVLGTIFPYLMKLEQQFAVHPGESLGRLAAVNTVGAILGSLMSGFLFLELFGMWRTMQMVAAAYLVAGLVLPTSWARPGLIAKTVGAVFLVLLLTFLSPVGLPVHGTNPNRPPERVLNVWEAGDCTVAVVEDRRGNRAITFNSNYRLGSTAAVGRMGLQACIPLLIYPQTRSIFFLGLGTGTTASAALLPEFENVERIVVCELVPEVVTAAREYMTDIPGMDFMRGPFTDPRSRILIEDGRHYLMAADDTFDMINADLFLPYRSGAGSLYSREHFAAAMRRLERGGVFVQWLPLYQITQNEFGIIARTMLDVFPRVTMWRTTFQPGSEVAALIGHRDDTPIPPCDVETTVDRKALVAGKTCEDLRRLNLPCNAHTVPFYYCGNLTAAGDLFSNYPMNTDDRPLIEYLSPRTLRAGIDGDHPLFIGKRFADLIDELLTRCPPETDPMLADRPPADRRLPLAGAAFYRAWVSDATGERRACEKAWRAFVSHWTDRSGQ